MRSPLILLAGALLLLPGADGTGAALDGLDVLVVSPAEDREWCGWIEDLLEAHGASVERVGWSAVAAERARGLVIVAGRGRSVGADAVDDLGRPVLGVGPYGHHYFGRTRLKHGHPFS